MVVFLIIVDFTVSQGYYSSSFHNHPTLSTRNHQAEMSHCHTDIMDIFLLLLRTALSAQSSKATFAAPSKKAKQLLQHHPRKQSNFSKTYCRSQESREWAVPVQVNLSPGGHGQYRKSFPSSHGQYRKSFPRQSWTVQEIFPQHAVPNSTGKFFSRISSSSGKFLIIS